MADILLVDDESGLRLALSALLERHGHRATPASTVAEFAQLYRTRSFDLVLLDIHLPDGDGIDTFRTLHQEAPGPTCVFMTADGSIPSAVSAIRAGGFDYITKPFDNAELLTRVERALEMRRLNGRVRQLERDADARAAFPGIVGKSEVLSSALGQLSKVAPTDSTVLLLGESGTGKELAARYVHRRSVRSAGPFVAINCAAIPGSIAEAELFGHEKGAFTDAHTARQGKFAEAQDGTLFLDEVAELSPEIQGKLLRVLQERQVPRLGARGTVPIDVRIVAATNRDLEAAVKAGSFRDDLLWRLAGFSVRLPPLRERIEDLPLLVDHILDALSTELGTPFTGISPRTLAALSAHDWPGNIRELESVLRRAAIMAQGQTVDITSVSGRLGSETGAASGAADAEPMDVVTARAVDRIERQMIRAALAASGGNRTRASAALGTTRRTLFSKMVKYHLAAVDDAEPGDA